MTRPQSPMEQAYPAAAPKPQISLAARLLAWLSGLGLATVLLVLIGLLTWLATLEQIDSGLYHTLRKYFDWRAWYLMPEIGGKTIPLPLPGGYWVCALLALNLTLGGLLRWRRDWQRVGVLIAHMGIIYLLVAGAVAHHFSQRGNMRIAEGATSNTAEDYFEHVVEVAEIKDGKPAVIQVIGGQYLTDLTGAATRSVSLSKMPIKLEVSGWLRNAEPTPVDINTSLVGATACDGYYLMPKPDKVEAEGNTPGCVVRVILGEGGKPETFLLSSLALEPVTLRHGERIFTMVLRKRLWLMPFAVRLDKFTADFYPGTMKPSKFVSEITRIEDGRQAKAVIQMNEPMRYANLTFYQASYDQLGQGPTAKMASVLEVVSNPADKWPQYSLYVVAFGLLVHFIAKLAGFILARSRHNPHV